jgi:hypothetical protein
MGHALSLHPDDLVERIEPNELFAELKKMVRSTKMEPLTHEQQEKLSLYLYQWVVVVLRRPSDPMGVAEVYELCELAKDLTFVNDQPSKTFVDQITVFMNLLEGLRFTLRLNAEEGLLKTGQTAKILKLAQGGEFNQSLLPGLLEVSKDHVTRLLGTMEAQRQIVRRKIHRGYMVALP